MKNLYLVLAIAGFIAPYYFFIQVPPENLQDLPALLQPLSANNLMRGIGMDLLISVLTFWTCVFVEATRLQMKHPWVYVLATLLVGLSFALPLFLYFRERKLESNGITNY